MSAAVAADDLRSGRPDIFYPIVPDTQWLARLLPLGIKTVQLRIKDCEQGEVRRQIAAAITLCQSHDCQLIINDYWREAIELGARYVHLGQEDLAGADVNAIKAAGIALGISTHSLDELGLALACEPDYVALGPIFETKLKAMKWQPQGLARIGEWKARIGKLPLVAIGGITVERAPGVLQSGADCVAVITDFYCHRDPPARVKTWLDWAGSARGQANSQGSNSRPIGT